MNKISELTYKVLAFSEIKDFNMNDCVDWATEMIELGYEQPAILILAATTKPANYFETKQYLLDAFGELKLKQKTGEDAVFCYAYYLIKSMAERVNLISNLRAMYELYMNYNGEQDFSDFRLLWWAWGDLDYGLLEQHYWPGADRSNIKTIVVDVARQRLAENEGKCKLELHV